MKTLNEFENIEQYFEGKLRGEALREFEERLKTDESFANLVDRYKASIKGIRLFGKEELKKKLITIHNELEIKETKRPSDIKWYLAAASVAAIITVVSIFYFTGDQIYSNDKLYAMHYKTYDADISTRSGNLNSELTLFKALEHYGAKNYEEASVLFNEILTNDESNMEALFFLGLSQMEQEKFEEAIVSFESIIENESIIYMSNARWYLGLCYLKADNNQKAVEQFRRIAADTSALKNNIASEILSKIETDN